MTMDRNETIRRANRFMRLAEGRSNYFGEQRMPLYEAAMPGAMPPAGGAPGAMPPAGGAPGMDPMAMGGMPPAGGAPGAMPPAGGAPGMDPMAMGGMPPAGGAPGGAPGAGGAPGMDPMAMGGMPPAGGAPGGAPGAAPGGGQIPSDTDGDGILDDLNGDGKSEDSDGDGFPESGKDPAMPNAGDDDGVKGDQMDVKDFTNAQETMNDKVNLVGQNLGQVDGKIRTLMGAIDSLVGMIDSNNKKISELEREVVMRNPTPTEKLNIRSQDSYPFNVPVSDFWKEKAETSNYKAYADNSEPTTHEYTITNSDVDDFSDRDMEASFDVDGEDLNQTINKIFGYR